MMTTYRKTALGLLLLGTLVATTAQGERLYCEDNKELRCIAPDQKVVSINNVCFDPKQCEGGFICRSKLDEMAAKYEAMYNKYNELANKHNEVIDAYEGAIAEQEQLKACVGAATSLAEVRDCI